MRTQLATAHADARGARVALEALSMQLRVRSPGHCCDAQGGARGRCTGSAPQRVLLGTGTVLAPSLEPTLEVPKLPVLTV